MNPPSSGKYRIVQPGKSIHEFEDSKAAVEHLVEHPGFAKVYAPDGRLLLTKGAPRPAD